MPEVLHSAQTRWADRPISLGQGLSELPCKVQPQWPTVTFASSSFLPCLGSWGEDASTDRSGLPLLTNEFNHMKQLSDKYVAQRQSARYIAPDSLQDDDLEKKIVACGHALAAMVASGHFQSDGSCQ
jgi:hypothetical protein